MKQPPFGLTLPLDVKDVKVYDGDTVAVPFGEGTLRVRLLDCWAPELRDPGGLASKEHAELQVNASKKVALHVPFKEAIAGMFTFGRVLGRLFVDGEDLSEIQVACGHATKERKRRS